MKKIFIYLGTALAASTFFAAIAYANPSEYATSSSTATATSTLVFMTPGTATTTLYYDAYGDSSGYKADSAALALQFTGSSTASSLRVTFEYTYGNSLANCMTTPAACDWYGDTLYGVNSVVSTSTTAMTIGAVNSYLVPFASSTLNGVAGNGRITSRLVNIPVPTRYVRAVITMPVGSLNGGVWASIRPDKEIPE